MKKITDITHSELCKIGAKWLLNHKSYIYRCNYLVTEFVSLTEESPDILGYKGGFQTIMVEVKMSRSDFLADKRKPHRVSGGVGQFRYYLCPKFLIYEHELPDGWGLLYYADGKIFEVKQSKAFDNRDYTSEMVMMYSIIRRLAKKRQVFNFTPCPLQDDPDLKQILSDFLGVWQGKTGELDKHGEVIIDAFISNLNK